MHKIHLDTDLGGDIDDICALAMLLRWPDAYFSGITTVAEEDGRRAGYVRYVLEVVIMFGSVGPWETVRHTIVNGAIYEPAIARLRKHRPDEIHA